MKHLKYFLLIVITLFILPISSNAVDNSIVGPGKEYQYLRDNKDINTINPNVGTVEVNGLYNFSLQLVNQTRNSTETERYNSGTEYITKGEYATEIFESNNPSVKKSKVFAFTQSNSEQYVYIRQAGFYMGKSIDIKLSIDTSKMNNNSLFRVFAPDYSERDMEATGIIKNDDVNSYENLSESFLYLGSAHGGPHSKGRISKGENTAFFYNITGLSPDPDIISYTYTFYETDLPTTELTDSAINAKKPIKINGLWNIDNANYVKSITDLNNFNDLTKYFIYKDPNDKTANSKYDIMTNSNNIVFKTNKNNQLEFTGNRVAAGVFSPPGFIHGKISTSLTTLFDQRDFLSYQAKNNYQIDMFGDAMTSGRGPMGIKYARSAIPRVAPTEPYIIGIKNTDKHNMDKYGDLQYDIRFGIGSNDIGKRNDALSIQTEVPNYYDINENNIYIVDMVSDTVLKVNKDYTVKIDPNNNSKATITFTNPDSDKINDGYFRISVNATTNDHFKFSPDKYGYLNDPSSEDNGYMHFDLAENTTLIYTHNASGNINKTISSQKIDDRSIAKVNYEGIPTAEAKTGATILQGNNIKDEFPDASSLVQDGFESMIDTNNLSRDTPVTASYIEPLPDTSKLNVGDKVNVPIRLTSKLGVTKDIIAEITIRNNKSLLNVEFRNEADELLSSVTKEYPIGTPIDLKNIPDVTNELNKYLSNGEYTLVSSPNPEEFILDSTNGTQVYRLKGNLIIASAPELFDFGTHEKKLDNIKQDQAINLDTQAPLTIKDRRADKSNGWTLQLKSITEFNSDGEVLTGAMIYRLNGTNSFTVSSSAEKAYEKVNGGDYNLSNDWSEDGAGLGINIDIKKIKKLGTYKAELEWELIAGTGP